MSDSDMTKVDFVPDFGPTTLLVRREFGIVASHAKGAHITSPLRTCITQPSISMGPSEPWER